MCWGCNPLCGGCRPPRQKAVTCSSCGWLNVLDIQAKGEPKFVGCERCGTDLTHEAVSVAAYCERFEVMCANLCGLSRKPLAAEGRGECQNIIVPDEWHMPHSKA